MIVMENQDDERCCGTGTCIINAQGLCWCGQQWDGEKMCRPALSGGHSGSTDNALPIEIPVSAQSLNQADTE
jgi:hypothetical protein